MLLLSKEEINTGRQFEFDFAKALCLLGMVFVHSFETFPQIDSSEDNSIYYLFVVILDVIFGAGTFMASMGLGIAYTKKNTPNELMKRGISIFILAYLLNIIGYCIPSVIGLMLGETYSIPILNLLLFPDILMFAGSALFLFGLLKRMNVSDLLLLLIALAMSIFGSLIRFLDVGPDWANQIVGVILPTLDATPPHYGATFSLLNWFIFVVFGYLLGQYLRRCTRLEIYYAVSFPISGLIIAVYLLVALPDKLGMMSGNLQDYYQLTTPETLIVFAGTLFSTGLYHYISKLFGEKVKKAITRLSSNINVFYVVHWFIITVYEFIFTFTVENGLSVSEIILSALSIYVISNLFADLFVKHRKRKMKNESIA